ncbi:MAG TPA: biopolymer transporter ExbD [Chitinophagaceae bacterium]|nr:biopolymer transporter ExbD [Chitinophagaceae bacterium]
MAELDTSSGGGHKKGGVKKAKKLSTRIDLTPMVDLGFLLITFFIFTTTMSKPKTMEINMPFKDPNQPIDNKSKVKESTALTILLSKDHRVYYYEGIGSDATNPPKVEVTNFKTPGIRQVIIDKKKKVDALVRSGALSPTDKTTVLIKPDVNSTYEDFVNIIDEMSINGIQVYAIVDISPVDKEFIALTEAANGGN